MVMFYFSGTGNSKYAAELFCREMGALCHSIEEDIDFSALITSSKTIGFCYPIYGSRVPRIMRGFVTKHMASMRGKNVIIFCTQMIFSGDGARALTDLFPRGHINVIYAEHFFMPNNVPNITSLFNPSKKFVNRSILKTQRKMTAVCRDINTGIIKKRGFSTVSRLLGLIQGSMWPRLEKRAARSIRINDNCNVCEKCTTACPMKNLKKSNGKIIHNNNCTVCYRCVNICPKKAITTMLHWKVRRQYINI